MRPITVEDYLRLDVRLLARQGYLEPGSRKLIGWKVHANHLGAVTVCAGSNAVDIMGEYGQCRGVSEVVDLESTPCRFGNSRRWFICPKCSRRCAILYVADSLQCRLCLGVPYLTDVLSKRDRLKDRREKAARQLGLDLRSGRVVRPRYMHLETWERHWVEYELAQEAIIADARF